jgi:hypothetical protein
MLTETARANIAGIAELKASAMGRVFMIRPVIFTLTMIAAVGLLQSGLLVAQKAIQPASQATVTTGQESNSGAGDLATIIQSGSTNTDGYSVVIHKDGSATAVMTATTSSLVEKQQFPAGTIDTQTLQSLLTQIGDVSTIPVRKFCPKPVSFATTTAISYAGKVSGDLQCIQKIGSGGDQALLQESEELARLVLTSLIQLKIDDRRFVPKQ